MLYASEQEIYVQAHSNLLKCATAGYQMGNGRYRHPFPNGIRQPASVCLKSKKCIMPSCRGAIGAVGSSAKTLVVSYIGMQEQKVTIRPNLKVMMTANTELLDEVVVTAYGTAKRSSFTGSASVVSSEEIGKIQTSNVANALNGKVSGVQLNNASGQPGSNSPSIRIRGISSINAENDPLVILDGVPYDGDLNNLSSQDIESMTVLKDAASNALYGARGANGVIMITTKKGSSGQAKVTVDAKWGANSRATRDYDMITDPGQYYEMYYGALNSYALYRGMDAAAAYQWASSNLTAYNDYGLGYNVYSVPNGENLIGENGKLNPNATLGNLVDVNGQQFLVRPDNWIDETYRTSLRQEYNVSVTAGNDKSSFYTSVNYLNNDGITANSDYERLTGRLKADYQVKDWLKVGANMAYTHFDANSLDEDGSSGSSGNVFAIATQIAPIYPLYLRDGNGNIMYDSNGFVWYDFGQGENAGMERPIFYGSNAIAESQLNTNNYEGNSINATGFFEVRFLKDFKFTSTNSAYVDETRTSLVTNPYYGQYANSNGILYKYHTRVFSYNFQQLLNWKRSFGQHNMDVMLGHESYRQKYYSVLANKSNMFDPTNNELAGAITNGSSDSYVTDYNTEGYFGRVQYDFAEKYFLSGSYRRDASSRFHPDNRWGNFWSASAAWNISHEEWFDIDWVDMLKFKVSYGSQGNDKIGDYRYVNTYNIVNSSGNPAAVPNTLGNKDITWETNANFNIGFDFELFKRRLTGTIEFFNRKTTDMLFSFPLPPSFGYTSYYANVGDMRNLGIEAEFKGTILETKDFQWDLGLNLTHYRNKITYLPEERKTMEVDGVKGYSSGNKYFGEGESLYTFYTYKYAGVNEEGEALYYRNVKDEKGNIVGQETVTNPSEADFYLCGTALPDVYGGFNTSLSYKGFDFSVDFAYQIGGQVYDSDYAMMMSSPTAQNKGKAIHKDMLDAWTSENKYSNIPRFQYGDEYTAEASDRFLTSASYLSLQNINAGYTLPANICRMFGVEKLRVYMAADNVYLWSKRKGMDPRQSISGSTTASYYAPMRTISGGITLTF